MNLFKPLDPQQVVSRFDRYFRKTQKKGYPAPTQIRIFSPKLGLDYEFPPDSTNQPYHIASIGKVFTAVLVYRLAERGLLTEKDLITSYLPAAVVERLFVYQGIDYAGQVTIKQLLSHTSGVADYFEGSTTGGESFLDELLNNAQFHWTPQKLLDFTRDHQAAVGAPGNVFNYSDTGYILLGLIVEAVTGKSFASNLEEEFFRPVEMCDSYLMFYSEPANTPKMPIDKIWFNHKEISGFESLSCDWSGGGIISTTADLLKFNRALRNGDLIRRDTLKAMDSCKHKFRSGIYDGSGMMEIRFRDFFFLLGNLPIIKGHIGILSTHMFYDPSREAHIILNFGSNTRMVESFKALIMIENILQRMR